jgi:hypothetical protein
LNHPEDNGDLDLFHMSLIASIVEVPPNREVVEVMCALELFNRLSQKGYLISAYPPVALTMEN